VDDWDDLRYLLAVARAGSVRGASRELGVDPSTVSRRLQTLEAQVGTVLVERSGRGLALTPAGEELRATAEKVRIDLSAALRRLADHGDDDVRGTVRVSFPQMLSESVHTLLAPVAQSHPHVTLELIGDDRRVNLVSGEAEVVLRSAPRPSPDLVGRRLGAMRLGVYASPSYSVLDEPLESPAHRWVDWSARCREQAAVAWLAECFPERRITLTAEHGLGTVDAVRAGMGIGILPEIIATGLVSLASLPDDRCPDLWLLCPPSVRRRPAVRVVMDALGSFARDFPTALIRARSTAASA